MLSLTVPFAIPNIQKLHVDAVQLDSNTNTGIVTCSAQGGGGQIYQVYSLQVRNGLAQGLRQLVTGFVPIEVFTATTGPGISTAFDDLVTAYGTAGNVATKNRAVETMMQAAALFPAGSIA